jgi:hypothetical protein
MHPSEPAARAARTSDVLIDASRTLTGERVGLHDLIESLGNRSFGLLLLILALPNVPPLGIPGLSTITGIPLALVALQMLWGAPEPYLPRWLAQRSVRRDDFCRLIDRTSPWLRKIERAMKPRWLFVTGMMGERVLGAFCLVLAVVMALPIPFGNSPPAAGIALIAAGMIEKDGILASIGVVVGVLSLFVVWGVLWTMLKAIGLFFGHLVTD